MRGPIRKSGIVRHVVMLASAGVLIAAASPGVTAQDRERIDRVMSESVGERVLTAQECVDAENYQCVLAELTPLLERDLSIFEQFVILRMRGFAYHSNDQTDLAIADFLASVETGAATIDDEIALRTNIGQLLIVTERYQDGIDQIEAALRLGLDISPSLSLMMAQAYAQIERFDSGLRYAELQFDTGPRERRNYQMLLLYYQQLENEAGQLRLISEMVERWPDDETAWTSLVALMARSNNESGAFEANKLMYLNGMLTDEREIVRLAQYYSYFEYPYRGAIILEREMNAGRVARNPENLHILANMWRQAREFERAIAVLEILAPQGDGEDYLRLAEAYYQENRLAEAEGAFEEALDLGGLVRPGDAWALLGTVRYEMDDRDGAMAAFASCSHYSYSRRTCAGWQDFMEGENRVIGQQGLWPVLIATEECRNTVRAELDLVTLGVADGRIDESGRPMITVPERCRDYFNAYGEQIGGHGFEPDDA